MVPAIYGTNERAVSIGISKKDLPSILRIETNGRERH